MRNLQYYCNKCLVSTMCLLKSNEMIVVNKPCEKVVNLIYKYGISKYESCSYVLKDMKYSDDSTAEIVIKTNIDFNEWYIKRFGVRENKKRLKEVDNITKKYGGII